MLSSKTASPLKGIFDQAKAKAAEVVMQPTPLPHSAPPVSRPRIDPTGCAAVPWHARSAAARSRRMGRMPSPALGARSVQRRPQSRHRPGPRYRVPGRRRSDLARQLASYGKAMHVKGRKRMRLGD
jgi:hypothetical protein